MKRNHYVFLSSFLLIFISCSTSVKVLSAWKSADADAINDRNILVIARTANKEAQIEFETSIANKLRATGLRATESFMLFPKMTPDKPMTEEREKLIRDIFGYEGYDAVSISVLKDYEESTATHYYNDYYMGSAGMAEPYSAYYPPYYGGFYSYYRNPYSYSTYGVFYSTGSSSYTTTTK